MADGKISTCFFFGGEVLSGGKWVDEHKNFGLQENDFGRWNADRGCGDVPPIVHQEFEFNACCLADDERRKECIPTTFAYEEYVWSSHHPRLLHQQRHMFHDHNSASRAHSHFLDQWDHQCINSSLVNSGCLSFHSDVWLDKSWADVFIHLDDWVECHDDYSIQINSGNGQSWKYRHSYCWWLKSCTTWDV